MKVPYKQITSIPNKIIKSKISELFKEDRVNQDFTSRYFIDSKKISTVYLENEEEIVFSGRKVIEYLFKKDFELNINYNDGELIKAYSKIATIRGNTQKILNLERTLLNLIQRMSGIATLTKKYVDLANHFNVKILDTRKTMPGLRYFDKYSVRMGGGYNHRFDLRSAILIKDNHLFDLENLKLKVEKVRTKLPKIYIEMEVETEQQLMKAFDAGVEGILLDNLSREKTIQFVEIIRKYDKQMFIETSGGINLNNISQYLDTGIDAISIGALTHSVQNSNLHLEIE